jgi:hypothetical protein
MHGRCREQRLEGRARQPDGATPAPINTPRAWREATLHPGPQGIPGLEPGGLLPWAGGLDGLMVDVGADRALAWSAFRRGARRAGGTRATGGAVTPDADDGIARPIAARPPMDAGLALGTARLLGLPVQHQGLPITTWSGLLWPTIGPKGRADPIDVMLALCGDQEVGIHIAAVQPVSAGQEITGGHIVHDRWPHDTIRRRGRRGEHLRDQSRLLWITGLREVARIAHPMGVTCTAVAGFQVVGGVDQPRRGRVLVSGAPAEHFPPGDRTTIIVLEPNPTQGFKRGESTQAWRALGSRHPVEELRAVRPDLPSQGLACARLLRQARLFGPQAIAGRPLPGHMPLDPGGRRLTELIAGVTHGFQHACEAVERADRGQDVGGIRPLVPRALIQPRALQAIRTVSNRRWAASWVSTRSRTSCKRVKSNPGSVNSRLRAYVQSIQRRTASAA